MKSNFDKEQYARDRIEIIEEIKRTLPDWQTKQGFFADGIYAPDIYEKQKLKILVLLSETYGYDKCGVTDIEKRPNLPLHVRTVPTINKISKLLWVIYKSISEGRELVNLPPSYNNTQKLEEALLKVAWVNIKKQSGAQSNQNIQALYEHARKNEHILKRQIDSIAPDLIIVCGDVAMNCACHFRLLGDGVSAGCKNRVQVNEYEQRILFLTHPAARKGQWSYAHIGKYYTTIYRAMSSEFFEA